MDDKDVRNQKLTQEVARWRNRALEAASKACFICEKYSEHNEKKCAVCRMIRIQEEAKE